MIGNLLDVSRMEAGMMDYKIESFNLVPLARGAASELEGLAREKKLDLVVEAAVPEIRRRRPGSDHAGHQQSPGECDKIFSGFQSSSCSN